MSDSNIENSIGIDTKQDKRFQKNIDSLYETELNNRDMDLSEAKQSFEYRKETVPVNTVANEFQNSNQQYTNNQYTNNQSSNSIDQITISRDDALDIKNLPHFTN